MLKILDRDQDKLFFEMNQDRFCQIYYQDQMMKLDFTKIFLDMWLEDSFEYQSNTQNQKILRLIILFLVKQLENGNKNIQQKLSEYLLNSENNRFIQVLSFFLNEFVVNKDNDKEERQLQRGFSQIKMAHRSEDRYFDLKIVLKLIQCLCENHFTNFQNFIRDQQMIANCTSHNLLRQLVNVLSALVLRQQDEETKEKKELSLINLKYINQCFETIIETV